MLRRYGPGRPLVFSHIPKTAGTSVRVALERSLRPERVVAAGFDGALLTGYDVVTDVSRRAQGQIFLSPDDLPADAELVSAHISPHSTMARYPGADHLTILRAPEARALSHYLHSRSFTELQLRHWGTARDTLRAGWLPLRRYLVHRPTAPTVDNTICRFLAWPHPLLPQDDFIDERHDDELVGAALDRLSQMQFVDVVEHRTFLEDLGSWLGEPLSNQRLNERSRIPAKRRPDLAAEVDDETRGLLGVRTRLDRRVWEHVAARKLPGTDLASLCAAELDGAIGRYTELLRKPDPASLKRRAVEWAYELRVAADPRRRFRP